MDDEQDIKYQKIGIIDGLRLMKESRKSDGSKVTYDDMVERTGVNRKELCNMIKKDGYEPPAWVWAKFGLQVTKEVPLCPVCGVVHTKACPAKNKPRTIAPRTPGGWVNAKDPDRAYNQIIKRAENTDYVLKLANKLAFYAMARLMTKED